MSAANGAPIMALLIIVERLLPIIAALVFQVMAHKAALYKI